MNQDQEHLRLLSIFHYVFGGLTALFSLFPLLYAVIGIAILMASDEMGFNGAPPGMEEMEALPAEEFPDDVAAGADAEDGDMPVERHFGNPPMSDAAAGRFIGGMLVAMGSLFFLFAMVFAALVIVAGRNLGAHRGYVYCLVIAALECLSVPFGTVLGVFTIVVLQRESVKVLFGQRPALEGADDY